MEICNFNFLNLYLIKFIFRYKGDFVDDKIQGYGTFTWKSGNK